MLRKFSTPNGVLMLCCHRSLIQCVIANRLISEGERCERGRGNVQCCGAASFPVNIRVVRWSFRCFVRGHSLWLVWRLMDFQLVCTEGRR